MKISPWILMALGVVFVGFIVGSFIVWQLVGRSYWVPKPTNTFLIQTALPIDPSSPTDLGDGNYTYRGTLAGPPNVYIVNAATLTSDIVDQLHARGAKVICQVPLVQWHPNTVDATSAGWNYVKGPAAGNGAYWLDVKPGDPNYQRLRGLMTLQFEHCGQMSVDGIIGDTADILGAHVSLGGSPITAADLQTYLTSLVQIAHSIGMSIGQTDNLALTPALEPSFDFAVVNNCFSHGTCAATAPYAAAHKAIFEIETTALPSRFCPAAAAGERSAGRYNPALNGRLRIPCM
jgi:hypothetical protein